MAKKWKDIPRKKKAVHNWIILGYRDFLNDTPFKHSPILKGEVEKTPRDKWPATLEQYMDGFNSAAKDREEGLI